MKLPAFNKLLFISTCASLYAFNASAANLQTFPSRYANFEELMVAAIVAAALIIAVLVLFLGRWVGNREKEAIKIMRQEAEKENSKLKSVAKNIYKQKKEASDLTQHLINQAEEFHLKRKKVEEYADNIIETSKRIQSQEELLVKSSNEISVRMDKIQAYWDTQLNSTVSTIQDVQTNLGQTLKLVDRDLDTLQEQKQLSKDLLHDFLVKHEEQSSQINNNAEITNQVSQNLEKTLHESTQLVDMLKQYQSRAESSMNKFTEELTNYEEQAYEQFDSSFQVADLARQELTANIDESHTHIENMRRHEEQSRILNTQTRKNLEVLDYSKIVKISNTLDSTQDMFSDIRHQVENTKKLLDELKDIETEVRNNEKVSDKIDIENNDRGSLFDDDLDLDDKKPMASASIYKMASGDNTTLSFFSKIKDKD